MSTYFSSSAAPLCCVVITVAALIGPAAGRSDLPPHMHAAEVVEYEAGTNPAPGFTDPSVVLGPPSRYTANVPQPGVVSPFQPAHHPSQVVSIGAGGHIVLRFVPPITDDALHFHQCDLIVFGNSMFTNVGWPGAIAGSLAADGGTIELSADGAQWTLVEGVDADGLFPTLGYLDAGPFGASPGGVLSDGVRPVNPSLAAEDMHGATHAAIVSMYAGSAGGIGIDIGAYGLETVEFVRIANPADAITHIEVDAVMRVAVVGDLNYDSAVDGADLAMLLAGWGPLAGDADAPVSSAADLNGDGVVDGADLAILLSAWSN